MKVTAARILKTKRTMRQAQEFIESVATTLAELFPGDPDLAVLVDEAKTHSAALRTARFSF